MDGRTERRRGLGAVLGAALVAGTVSVSLVLGEDRAGAGELATFGSCAELAAWEPAAGPVALDDGVWSGDDAAVGAAAPATGATPAAAAERSDGAVGDTNVAVDGVDELDVVDRVDDSRALVAAGGRLSLVDLVAGERRAHLAVPGDARLTFDGDAGVAWVAGTGDGGGVEVTRVAVEGDTLVAQGTWTTSGWLVDARRTGDRLHVVAVDSADDVGTDRSEVPFPDGPVPCDRVLHPTAPSGGGATLLVTLTATGAVEPVDAAEVVGAGSLVHVTDSAAYLATPLWDGGAPETSVHRFDLDTLAHTGSGRVEGTLLDQFSMSEHEGHLRLALTSGAGNGIFPIPVDAPVRRSGPGPEVDGEVGADDDGARNESARNEIVVLDTEGDLDETGRSERFGHPGETLHGIRFDGPVAYAVTFLTTDPFYVVDVGDPSRPRVVGEVELPGFSAYLHPVGEGLVAGFGPDGNGRTSVKLFDVADPASPSVADSEVLGDHSPVVGDHHAFLGLGEGRFAVPVTWWRASGPEPCSSVLPGPTGPTDSSSDVCLSSPSSADTEVVVVGTAAGALDVEVRLPVPTSEPGSRVLSAGGRWAVLAGSGLLVVDPGGAVVARVDLS